jgi:Fe2+ or Zn2+ uptake regulation protein
VAEPPLDLSGAMWRYDPKDDPTDDCFRAGGDLWRVMTEDKKQLLIDNTAADIASVTENIKYRHAVHCLKADEEYGRRMTEALGLEDPRISRGTVYRNLNLLEENGEILHVKVPGVDRFDWRVDCHYHLLCTGCGAVSDVPCEYHAELDGDLAQKTGYRIARHRTIFEGLCPVCQAAEREKSR